MRTEPSSRAALPILRPRPQPRAGELWQTTFTKALSDLDDEERQEQERKRARLSASASYRAGKDGRRRFVLMMTDRYGDSLQAHIIDQHTEHLLRHIGENELAGMQQELTDYAGRASVTARRFA